MLLKFDNREQKNSLKLVGLIITLIELHVPSCDHIMKNNMGKLNK
jgi:hypothetical protein